MRRNILFIFISLLALGLLTGFFRPRPQGSIQIKICLDRSFYESNSLIGIAVVIYSAKDTHLDFNTSQIYDLILLKDGKQVWKWSDGKMFTQVMGSRIIKANEPLLFSVILDSAQIGLTPGKYELTPIVCSRNPQSGQKVTFEIR